MMRSLPAPVRMLYPLLIDRPWKKYAATPASAARTKAASGLPSSRDTRCDPALTRETGAASGTPRLICQ